MYGPVFEVLTRLLAELRLGESFRPPTTSRMGQCGRRLRGAQSGKLFLEEDFQFGQDGALFYAPFLEPKAERLFHGGLEMDTFFF